MLGKYSIFTELSVSKDSSNKLKVNVINEYKDIINVISSRKL